MLPGATARKRRALWLVAVGAVTHLACKVAFVCEGRFFASEDDPYRAYAAFLLQDDLNRMITRFWLMGFELCSAFAQQLGAPTRWAGILVNTVAFVTLFCGVARVAKRLAPEQPGFVLCAAALVVMSPMGITLGHSSLSDLLAACLVVWAADGFMAYLDTRRLSALARCALTITAATWVRYEPWVVATLLVPAVAFVEWRPPGQRRLRAPALAMVALLGPLAWLFAQNATFGDPLYFFKHTRFISESFAETVSATSVVRSNLLAMTLWFPHVVVLAILGWGRGRRLIDLRAGFAFSSMLLVCVLPGLVTGAHHPVFPERLSYLIELALVPWAAVGLNWILELGKRLPGWVAAALLLGVALTALRPPAIVDVYSVEFGRRLLRDESRLDPTHALLVERPQKRLPFGWASVGVLWGQWERIVWITPEDRGWTIVEPTDVYRPKRSTTSELGSWFHDRGIGAAWVSSPELVDVARSEWNEVAFEVIGEHRYVARTRE